MHNNYNRYFRKGTKSLEFNSSYALMRCCTDEIDKICIFMESVNGRAEHTEFNYTLNYLSRFRAMCPI